MIQDIFAFRERVKAISVRPKARQSTTQLTMWITGNNTRGLKKKKKDYRSVGTPAILSEPFPNFYADYSQSVIDLFFLFHAKYDIIISCDECGSRLLYSE